MNRAPPPGGWFDSIATVHRGAVQAAFEAIITVDQEQRIVMINPAAERMFCCGASEVLGSELSRFIPQRFRESHARHVDAFKASAAVELPMGRRGAIFGLRSNGEEFPLEASISRVEVRGKRGATRYFTVVLRDLSGEQVLQAEIVSLNRRMRAIFELAPVAIWITEADQIVFANKACDKLFGATDPAQLVGRSFYSLLRPESHAPVREQVAQTLATGIPVPVVNERIARLDGTTCEVEIALASLPDHGRTAVQMVITDITERTRERHRLERSRGELRRLSASLVQAREEERRRIARELHDELGQRLTALKMELAGLAARQPAPPGQRERIGVLFEMVDETIASVRRIATELRPLMLDDLGLNAAIEWLARNSGRLMGIPVELNLGADDPPVGEAARIALYRMVQEALTNIARHARASKVRIEIGCTADELLLVVEDDGVGFSKASMHREGAHGLMGMRERAHMLGGTLQINERPDGGGSISVRLPLRPVGLGAEDKP